MLTRVPGGALVVAMVAVVALTLLGIGGAAGNGVGLLFWALLAIVGAMFAVSVSRESPEGSTGHVRKSEGRDGR
jgi:hypothetical protein